MGSLWSYCNCRINKLSCHTGHKVRETNKTEDTSYTHNSQPLEFEDGLLHGKTDKTMFGDLGIRTELEYIRNIAYNWTAKWQ